MLEEEIEIRSEGVSLAGTFCVPAHDDQGQFPTVLMIHGSGPLDRNENMKGQRLEIFNAIAHGLAEHGIASLRYDKRGCGASSGEYFQAGHADFVADAVNCLDVLTEFDQVAVDKVFILGHSEGCIIAPQVCSRRPFVAGMILLCPLIERLEPILLKQAMQIENELDGAVGPAAWLSRSLRRIFGGPLKSQKRLIRKLKSTSSPVIRVGLARIPAKWLRELMDIDPANIFRSTKTPMLVVGGEKDLQCNPNDIFQIAEIAGGPTETWLVENMTHVLRTDTKSPSLIGSAHLLKKPMERVVVDRAARWIHATTQANNGMRPAQEGALNNGKNAS